ncbi:MAG: sigma-70 family RNA polymerase sigma factor [Phycisphaerales bacterium]|nr:sigma-70 family RNA polymerase sigma factor [Phycisphaerales bacterium]
MGSPRSSEQHDVFPPTLNTWIDRKIDEGETGRPDLNHYVMSVYADPLKVYFRGCSMRWLGEPDDIIAGFFANRLARPNFFNDWKSAGNRLRRWLMNALLFYLREVSRERRRHGHVEDVVDEIGEWTDGPEAAVDRAWAFALVRNAWERASNDCRDAGQTAHWEIFVRHHHDGEAYRDIAPDFGVDASQAAVMVRTVTKKFKQALRDCIAMDGVAPGEIDDEIRMLLEITGS